MLKPDVALKYLKELGVDIDIEKATAEAAASHSDYAMEEGYDLNNPAVRAAMKKELGL